MEEQAAVTDNAPRLCKYRREYTHGPRGSCGLSNAALAPALRSPPTSRAARARNTHTKSPSRKQLREAVAAACAECQCRFLKTHAQGWQRRRSLRFRGPPAKEDQRGLQVCPRSVGITPCPHSNLAAR